MSNETIIKYLDEVSKYKLRSGVSSYSQIYYYHGSSFSEYYAKKSAKFIKKNYSNSKVICLAKNHCEISLLHPDIMIKELNKILMQR